MLNLPAARPGRGGSQPVPYHHPVMFSVNRKLTKRGGKYDPGQLRSDIGDSTSLVDALPRLLAKELDNGSLVDAEIGALLQFAAEMPASIDVAIVAAVKQALEDGYWVHVTWQPGVDWELRTWALAPDAGAERGVLNLFLISPNPEAPLS
jgi:hypothetical protein